MQDQRALPKLPLRWRRRRKPQGHGSYEALRHRDLQGALGLLIIIIGLSYRAIVIIILLKLQ